MIALDKLVDLMDFEDVGAEDADVFLNELERCRQSLAVEDRPVFAEAFSECASKKLFNFAFALDRFVSCVSFAEPYSELDRFAARLVEPLARHARDTINVSLFGGAVDVRTHRLDLLSEQMTELAVPCAVGDALLTIFDQDLRSFVDDRNLWPVKSFAISACSSINQSLRAFGAKWRTEVSEVERIPQRTYGLVPRIPSAPLRTPKVEG